MYKSHYENVPFEIPKSWVLSDFSELVTLLSGRDLESNDCNSNREGIPYLIGASNIVDGKINITRWTTRPLVISKRGNILISCKGTIGEVVTNVIGEIHIARQFMAIQTLPMVYADYIELYIKSIVNNIKRNARGVIPGISREDILQREIALPPLEEQKRIVFEVEKWLDFIADIEAEKNELESHIKKTKSKILDLAISGKLVPQDPNDEPAIKLLKRINPDFHPCDNSHYENLPVGWTVCRLEDVCKIYDNQRLPINSTERQERKKNARNLYPYYGATGQVDLIDEYRLDGTYILLGEDGAPFLDKFANKAYIVTGMFWVNNHAHILKPECDINFLTHYLNSYDYSECVNGSTRLKLTQADMKSMTICLPPLPEQYRISTSIKGLFANIDTITAEL